jgi:electron transport complex protein RnfB
MVNVTGTRTGWNAWTQEQADTARARHDFRTNRLRREKAENDARLAAKADAKLKNVEAEVSVTEQEKAEQARKKEIIQAAIARAQKKKEEMAAAHPDNASSPTQKRD